MPSPVVVAIIFRRSYAADVVEVYDAAERLLRELEPQAPYGTPEEIAEVRGALGRARDALFAARIILETEA